MVQEIQLPVVATKNEWTILDSEKLYRIDGWGEPYFSINEAGHVTVSPMGDRGGCIDLFELIHDLKQRNLRLPMLLRFSDILADRIERINSTFAKAIARYNYNGVYRGVYPVKVNQQRQLVEELVEFGKPYQFGLEAGSKPELLIALATLKTPGALLICNGYKDLEYIETALLSQRLGQTPIIVLEQLEEVDLVIQAATKLGIDPILGVRAKLSSKGIGRWEDSAGDRAKFGLSMWEILEVVDRLQAAGLLNSLQLLHFHIGSQISSIGVIKDALKEAGQIYVQLVALNANMKYIDVGGGLGVDYDGSKTNFYASKNYSMQNYAYDVVAAIKEACAAKNIPVPTLVSESGRAIASHQSILIFDVLNTSGVPNSPIEPLAEGEHLIIRNLFETLENINVNNYQEVYHDAAQFKEEAVSLFTFGYLSLRERARVERLYWECCDRILKIVRQQNYVPDDLEDLERIMAHTYYCNFSVFQSAPDSWAIDQLFPIMPIHRLNEEPTCRGTLADLTCDSDGKIDRFIDLRDVKSVLELHPFYHGEPYYLALFLGGAYQEILGDLHNLFGDTDAVHIHMTPRGYQVEHVIKGDSMTEVLQYVQYSREGMLENLRRETERALQAKQITLAEARLLLQNYEHSLSGYTYLS
ncbi:biosynthetic arginine decarboxylase [Tumidithrix elongata RA019]|uniref:Biosynthetic arginine decarboxylase n=1 Tax=Tumidithrix elongata BACA0141 TaxID=2716417 RepID=A0AAW9Q179_9CYAN|nr:biosynthetic arginine decarboxylase [Tumidithrix elongata RA019]